MLVFYVSPRLLEIIHTWALKGRGGIFFRSKIDRGGGRGSYFSSPTFPEQTPLPKEHNKQVAPKCRQKRWWRRILEDPGADRGAGGKLGRAGNDGGGRGRGERGGTSPPLAPSFSARPSFPSVPRSPPPLGLRGWRDGRKCLAFFKGTPCECAWAFLCPSVRLFFFFLNGCANLPCSLSSAHLSRDLPARKRTQKPVILVQVVIIYHLFQYL